LVVLVLGNWIRWDGKTLSAQVRSKMASATRETPALLNSGMNKIRSWSDRITTGASSRDEGRAGSGGRNRRSASAPNTNSNSEKVSATERQKLRSLIQELNSDQPQDISRR